MSIYTAQLQELVLEFVKSGQSFQPNQIAEQFITDHGDLVQAEWERLQHDGIVRKIKTYLKSLSEDDDVVEQMRLPGMHLPSVIAIPAEVSGGYVYKNTMDCTFEDLQAGRYIRNKNVEAAMEKLDRYDEAVRMLRPAMEYDPSLTVRDAVNQMMRVDDADAA